MAPRATGHRSHSPAAPGHDPVLVDDPLPPRTCRSSTARCSTWSPAWSASASARRPRRSARRRSGRYSSRWDDRGRRDLGKLVVRGPRDARREPAAAAAAPSRRAPSPPDDRRRRRAGRTLRAPGHRRRPDRPRPRRLRRPRRHRRAHRRRVAVRHRPRHRLARPAHARRDAPAATSPPPPGDRGRDRRPWSTRPARIADPHRAIDWLSTLPQVALAALGEARLMRFMDARPDGRAVVYAAHPGGPARGPRRGAARRRDDRRSGCSPGRR